MMLPGERSYKTTKLLKQGEKALRPPFSDIAVWIGAEFGVTVLNAYCDTISHNKCPRLNIILDYESEARTFKKGDSIYGNYDSKKQKKVAEKFRELVRRLSSGPNAKTIKGIRPERLDTDSLFVTFEAFESTAKTEANEGIPESEIIDLKRELNDPELWLIAKGFTGAVFFFYTKSQVAAHQADGSKKRYEDRYFDILKKHDTFGYYKRETFAIALDSKENFDKNYQGNWYNYYR